MILRLVKIRTWLHAVLLFFAWGFVMHTTGLLLHEFGGHALAAMIFGCGITGYDLTFFGHGQVHYFRCDRWTDATVLVADWAGLVVTILTALGVGVYLWRRGHTLSPLARLLLAEVVFFFLLGQLGYMVSGGFHDLYDPGRTAKILGAKGLHVLAWLPPLVAYGVTAFVFARVAADAFREHFGSRTRLHALGQLVLTLGVAGLLYFIAFKIELELRTDMTMKGVAHEARRIAIVKRTAPPFPIERVLTAVGLAGLIYGLARPVKSQTEMSSPSARLVKTVLGATALCFVVLFVMIVRR